MMWCSLFLAPVSAQPDLSNFLPLVRALPAPPTLAEMAVAQDHDDNPVFVSQVNASTVRSAISCTVEGASTICR